MKKVAILVEAWKKYLNYAWIGGCQEYLREHQRQVDLYVYNSFGNYSLDENYNKGEYNIFRLPDFREFDAVILELNNLEQKEIKTEILGQIAKANIPIVAIGEELEGCVYVGPDNYRAIYDMVEHVIRKHGCKQLNFIGGPKENLESQLRYQAYCDVLAKYNIPLEAERVYFGDFSMETGEKAFAHFVRENQTADAYICVNDNTAVGLCYEAERLGVHAPTDFLVTGFDNFDKAEYFMPRISTVAVTREDMAYKALDLLFHIWDGDAVVPLNYVDTMCKFSESCGCVAEHPKDRGTKIVEMIYGNEKYERLQTQILMMKKELINCSGFGELMSCLQMHLKAFKCDKFCVVINRDIWEEVDGETDSVYGEISKSKYNEMGYPSDMLQIYPKNEIFKKEQGRSGKIYLFAPLHFREREVGYICVCDWEDVHDAQLWFEIVYALQETMEQLHHRVVLNKLNLELSNLYLKDSLTGLYNRVAYGRLAQPMFDKYKKNNKPLAIMFVDLDRLKYINDTFGHDMGNVAIKAIADAMLLCCPKKSIIMRYGGDEFVALAPVASEAAAEKIKIKIKDAIKRRDMELNTGFVIEASIGYAVTKKETAMNMNDYINLADERMYEEKKARNAQRV